MKIVSSCIHNCPDTCSIVVEHGEDGSVSMSGNPEHPFTRGFLCAKMQKHHLSTLARPDRVTTPLLRKGTELVPVSWNEALDLWAAKIQALRVDPAAILHIHGHAHRGLLAQGSNHFHGMLGSSSLRGSLCDDAGIAAFIQSFGSLMHDAPENLEHAGRIVNWGRKLHATAIHLAAMVQNARKRGVPVLTVTPGGDGLEAYSDIVVRIRPGGDRFLAAAALRRLLDRGRISAEAVEASAHWPALADTLVAADVEDLCRAAGCTTEDADTVADWYAMAEPVATLIGWGLQRCLHGGESVRFISALALLSGHVGRKGAGAYFSVSSSAGLDLSWSKQQYTPPRRLPTHAIGRAMLEAADPALGMVVVEGFNVVTQAPESDLIAQALCDCPYTVVFEAFLNDTAQCADLVLPCRLPLEREEIIGSSLHPYLHYAAPAIEPPADIPDNYAVYESLGRRLDPVITMPDRETFMAKGLGPSCPCTLEELKAQGFVRLTRPEVAYEGLRFDHPDGLHHLPEVLSPELPEDPDYPMLLLTVPEKAWMHSQIPDQDQAAPPELRANPDSPHLAGLDLQAPLRVATCLGHSPVRLVPDATLDTDTLMAPRGYGRKRGGLNRITPPEISDVGENCAYYSARARLENGA